MVEKPSSSVAAEPDPSGPAPGAGSPGPTAQAAATTRSSAPLPRFGRAATLGLVLGGLIVGGVALWSALRQPPHPDMWRPIGEWDLTEPDWWLHPLERNAFKRLVIRGDLHAVSVSPDGERVWAVGENGLIVHSPDGGRQWVQQNPLLLPRAPAADSASTGFDWLPVAHAAVPSTPPDGGKGGVPNAQPLNPPPQQQQQQQQQAPLNNEPAAKGIDNDRLGVVAPSGASAAPPSNANTNANANANAVPSKGGARPATPAASVPRPQAAGAPLAAASAPAVPPEPMRATLHSVRFVDGRRGWALGDGGALLATADAGASWRPQDSGVRTALRALAVLPDGQRGWAVGDRGVVLGTSDGGRRWRTLRPAVEGEGLLGLAVSADGRRLLAVGGVSVERPLLLASTDGGERWRVAAAPAGAGVLVSVVIDDGGAHGWLVDAGGQRFETTDGGSTWAVPAGTATDARLQAVVTSPGGSRAWGLGLFGLLQVRGPGEAWTAVSVPTQADLRGMAWSADGQRAWVVGDNGTLLTSGDGGQSWQVHADGLRHALADADFTPDGRRGWAVAGQRTVLATDDGGRHWRVQLGGSSGAFVGVSAAADGLRAWTAGTTPLGGDEAAVIATADGGRTWAPVPVWPAAAAAALAASPAASSADAGGDLTPGWRVAPRLAFGVRFTEDGQAGWVAGSDALHASIDGGRTWQPRALGADAPGDRRAMRPPRFLPDKRRGWLLGLEFRSPGIRRGIGAQGIAVTSDGGASWAWQRIESDTVLSDLALTADGMRGWLVGERGRILATDDGGRTWAPQASGTGVALLRVHASADGRRAWAVGEAGTVLATVDGGRTWAAQDSGTRSMLTWVGFQPGGQRGLAVGHDGTVLATDNGGQTWHDAAAYQRYPAPLVMLALLLSVLALGGAVAAGSWKKTEPGGGTAQPLEDPLRVQAELRNDHPLTSLKDDRLNHAPAVRALADFMLNRDTDPHLTLAITAPWGMGKSSMMGMLRSELEAGGFRTAWFNAWHHQQEGRQLTALFNTIRQQAVPSIFRRPVAALRVRMRLLWLRGWLYRMALVLAALVLADVFLGWRASGVTLAEFARVNVNHHWLDTPRVAITPAALDKLNPFEKAKAASSAAPDGDVHPCAAPPGQPAARKEGARLRGEVWCFLRGALTRPAVDSGQSCRDPREIGPQRCVFASRDKLLDVVNHSLYADDATRYLMAGERQAIAEALEPVPPPALTPTIVHFLPLLALLGVLMTKGFAVYGIELLRPLRALVAHAPRADGGSEPAGTIERYRREFRLLTDALDGRLVVFIDDLDRCDVATVNSLLEITNYLVDHGRCFLVLGADMDKVKACIEPKLKIEQRAEREAYQAEYLRKLVHIEMPVPAPSEAALDGLLNGSKAAPGAPAPGGKGWGAAATVLLADQADALRRRLVFWLPLLVMLGLAFVVAFAAKWLVSEDVPYKIEPAAPVAAGSSPAIGSVSPGPRAASEPVSVASRPAPAMLRRAADDVGLTQGEAAGERGVWLGVALVAGMLLLLAWQWRELSPQIDRWRVVLGGVLRTSDSQDFANALDLWKSAVRLGDATPRGIKRFVNRARLFATVERKAQGTLALREADVVALTAMHHVQPAFLARFERGLQAGVGPEAPTTPGALDDDANAQAQLDWLRRAGQAVADPAAAAAAARSAKLGACLQEHARRFGRLPGAEAAARFRELLERVSVR